MNLNRKSACTSQIKLTGLEYAFPDYLLWSITITYYVLLAASLS
jgi:hypothetical protein